MASAGAAAPYYLPLGNEVELFLAAFSQRLPVLLKGPTGCGKTRFVEHMAWRIFNDEALVNAAVERPLTTISCHEDLTSTDLIGRYLFVNDSSDWIDGPLTSAVRHGGICYLDEIVEARKDTTVLIHSLTDHRRILPIDKLNQVLDAHPDFLLVISYNPGYQSILKDLKPSTRQRFMCLQFDYPSLEREAEIIRVESGIDPAQATTLAKVGLHIRNLREHGFEEGVSTRLLVYAGTLMREGVAPRQAADAALVHALSDDEEVQQAIADIVDVVWP